MMSEQQPRGFDQSAAQAIDVGRDVSLGNDCNLTVFITGKRPVSGHDFVAGKAEPKSQADITDMTGIVFNQATRRYVIDGVPGDADFLNQFKADLCGQVDAPVRADELRIDAAGRDQLPLARILGQTFAPAPEDKAVGATDKAGNTQRSDSQSRKQGGLRLLGDQLPVFNETPFDAFCRRADDAENPAVEQGAARLCLLGVPDGLNLSLAIRVQGRGFTSGKDAHVL